jgi:hypothetical protein
MEGRGGEGRRGDEFSGASTILFSICYVYSLELVIIFSTF